jgi:hypothetical protein
MTSGTREPGAFFSTSPRGRERPRERSARNSGVAPVVSIDEAPAIYFKPPYVGASGWIGIRLDRIRDDALRAHLREVWQLIERTLKKPRSRG